VTEPSIERPSPIWERAFLAALHRIGVVGAACEAADVARSTVYARRSSDPEFAHKWRDAQDDAADHAPRNLDKTLEALAAVGAVDEASDARSEAVRRKLEDCDTRLGKYRAALDSGGDPIVIAGWIQEVQGERLTAQRELARRVPSEPLNKAELRSLVRGVRDAVKMLSKADPALKAEVYQGLGLRLEYRPAERLIAVEVPLEAAWTTARVGGGT
jgi:site-specific DNA recombinase